MNQMFELLVKIVIS